MDKDQKPKSCEEETEEELLTERRADQDQQIVKTGSVTPAGGKYVIHCLTIIGQVEGHYILPPQNKTTKYEHVIPQLVAIQQDSQIEGLIVILNTVGGDVEAGLAIAELIAGMNKPTVSLVLGGGHSIGVPLAVSARQSFIAPSATMTIHPVRMNGLVLGVPQTLSYFDKMQERIVRFVRDKFLHLAGAVPGTDDDHRRTDDGCGYSPGRRSRSGGRAHRSSGRAGGSHRLPLYHDRRGAFQPGRGGERMILYTPVPMDTGLSCPAARTGHAGAGRTVLHRHPQRERGADHPALLHLPGRLSPGGIWQPGCTLARNRQINHKKGTGTGPGPGPDDRSVRQRL